MTSTNNTQATVATQQFLDFSAQQGNIHVHVKISPDTGIADIEVTKLDENNALSERFEQTIDILQDKLCFAIDSLSEEDQQIAELLEAGLMHGVYLIIEEHCQNSQDKQTLKRVIAQKEQNKALVEKLLKQLKKSNTLKHYPELTSDSDTFLLSYETLVLNQTNRPQPKSTF